MYIINIGSPESLDELKAIEKTVTEMEDVLIGTNAVFKQMITANEIFHRPGFKFEFAFNSYEAAKQFGIKASKIGMIYEHVIESNIREFKK